MTETAIARFEDDEQSRQLARIEADDGVTIEQLVARVEKVHAVAKRVMKDAHHYGVIPGTKGKKTLLKPGAELLMLTFQLDPQFSTDERREGEHLECVVTCTLYHAPTGKRLGSNIGSCTTKESKYAWRSGGRKCPKCGASAIIKGKAEYGGGWICFAKKDGCGAKFGDKDPTIVGQSLDRVPNPDLPDMYNTVRKMACKRALVAAVLSVTGASEIFTQDAEDFVDDDEHKEQERKPPAVNPHDQDGDSELGDPEIYEMLRGEIASVDISVEVCDTYEKLLTLRGIVGTKGGQPTDWQTRYKAAYDSLNGAQRKELGRLWQRCDRSLSKLEKTITAPDAAASFVDPDPEDFDRSL